MSVISIMVGNNLSLPVNLQMIAGNQFMLQMTEVKPTLGMLVTNPRTAWRVTLL